MSEEILDGSVIEPIIFKLAATEVKYANFVAEYYETGLFDDPVLGTMMETIVNKFYLKKNELPTGDTIKLLSNMQFKDQIQAQLRIESALHDDISGYDREFIDEQVIAYMKNVGYYNVITDSIADLNEKSDFAHMERLEKITNMSFYSDMGMDYVFDLEDHLAELAKPDNKTSTYWPELDKLTAGGYNKDKNLIIFAASAGLGKSIALAQSATNYLRDGKFVIIVSLEMSADIYAKRIDSMLANIDIDNITGNADAVRQAAANIKEGGLLRIKEFPPDSTNCGNISNYIDSLIRLHNREPDLIVIDYLGLLGPNSKDLKGANSYSKMDAVSKEMRAMTYKYCTILTAAQLNRDSHNIDEPSLANIADSLAISYTADAIFAFYQNDLDKEDALMNMVILKNRLGGRCGMSLQFNIDYETLRLTDGTGGPSYVNNNATKQDLGIEKVSKAESDSLGLDDWDDSSDELGDI